MGRPPDQVFEPDQVLAFTSFPAVHAPDPSGYLNQWKERRKSVSFAWMEASAEF